MSRYAGKYVWGGAAGALGRDGSVTITFPSPGTYPLSVFSPATNNYLQSNTISATVTVTSNHVVNNLMPLESSYTVTDPSSPMNGQTYGRMWRNGGWTAYLGRAGAKFQVKGQAYPTVKAVELQAKAPGADWALLASQAPSNPATSFDGTFSVMLGEAAQGMPLVPASFLQGSALTGTWSFRARVQDSNGGWSDFSDEVPVEVILPVVTRSVSGQTVPPAGPLGDWFNASPIRTFSIPLWVP